MTPSSQVPPLWQGLLAHSSMLTLHMLPAGRGRGAQLLRQGPQKRTRRRALGKQGLAPASVPLSVKLAVLTKTSTRSFTAGTG